MSAVEGIVLQKSKVAPVQIFGETLRREAIDDSDNLSRATEVAYEFCVRRRGPSDPYTKTASAALRIFDTFGKTTFATLSREEQTSKICCLRSTSTGTRRVVRLSGWGVVNSLARRGCGPVGLFCPQKSQFFKTKNPLLGLCSGGSHSAACAS